MLTNATTDVVDEALDGVLLRNPSVRRIEGYNVIVQAEIARDKVALISGGGSGHEPSHADWVGQGMLTAAVCGPVFASPSVAQASASFSHHPQPPLTIERRARSSRRSCTWAVRRACS